MASMRVEKKETDLLLTLSTSRSKPVPSLFNIPAVSFRLSFLLSLVVFTCTSAFGSVPAVSICLSASLSACVCLSARLSCLSLSACLSACLSVFLSPLLPSQSLGVVGLHVCHDVFSFELTFGAIKLLKWRCELVK